MTQLSLPLPQVPGPGSIGELGILAEPRRGRVHTDAHDTEVAAAESVAEGTGRLRARVLGLLRAHPGGLTDDEGGRLLRAQIRAADRLTFGRRRQELYAAGLVADSGRRRRTPRGRSAIVWVAVERGGP